MYKTTEQSKAAKAMLLAYEKGYRVVGNDVVGVTGQKLKLNASGKNYNPRFSVRGPNREHLKVEAGKLSAYQKFGDRIFDPNLVIRHSDSDPMNIRESNFELMTFEESEQLKGEETHKRCSKNAASHLKKYDNDAVREFYWKCKSYELTMKEFGIPSKGTLHYILHKRGKKKEKLSFIEKYFGPGDESDKGELGITLPDFLNAFIATGSFNDVANVCSPPISPKFAKEMLDKFHQYYPHEWMQLGMDRAGTIKTSLVNITEADVRAFCEREGISSPL